MTDSAQKRALKNYRQRLSKRGIARFEVLGLAGDREPVRELARRSLLDTSILSNFIPPEPSTALVSWMSQQADEDLLIASVTLAEIRRGVQEKPPGRRREQLERWFDGPDGPQALFAGRILPFDERAGLIWAGLMADATSAGIPRSAIERMIAAVAAANDCTLVTDNEKHFAGLQILLPLRGQG